jgi:hypothetical protein
MKLVYAKDPKWANRSQTIINLVVRFEEIDEDLPFSANPNDVEAHGKDIFVRAKAGEFGQVADFAAIAPTVEQVTEALKSERNARLAATDWTQLPDVPQATRDLWEPYRQALRDFPQQSGFPWYDTVVSETDFGYDMDVSKAPWPSKPA